MKLNQNHNGLTTQIPIKNKQGVVVGHKEVVTYRGLLAKAHEDGLKQVETSLIQHPTEANAMTAIVQAKAVTARGTFSGIGDASPKNVNHNIAPHVIRMAETRAKARALRDAVNIGVVCMEELGAEMDGEALYEGNVTPTAEERRATQPPQSVPDNGGCLQNRRDEQQPVSGGNGKQTNDQHHPVPGGNGNEAKPAAFHRPTTMGRGFMGPELMTENQRRYLFRLLAQKGLMGEAAKEWLQKSLGVAFLKDATKPTASDLIESLLRENGGNGEVDHASAC